MSRIVNLLLVLLFCTAMSAQKSNTRLQRTPAKEAKAQTTKKSSQTTKKSPQTPKRPVSQTTKRPVSQTTKRPAPQTTKQQLQEKKKEVAHQQQVAKKRQVELESQVKKRIQDVEALGSEIDDKASTIKALKTQISGVSSDIAVLDSQLVGLRSELENRRKHYIRSVRYMYRNRSIDNQVAFVLSAKSFNQMYRRARFVGQYAGYQKKQAEAVKEKSKQVEAKLAELGHAHSSLDSLLAKGKEQQIQLQQKRQQQQLMVESLKKEQATVKSLILQQQQQEAALDRQIDRIVEQELERARKAEEERLRKLAEQRKREQERKAAAAAAREKAQTAKRLAAQTTKRLAAQTTKRPNAQTTKRPNAQTTKRPTDQTTNRPTAQTSFMPLDADKKLTGGFVANKGRLPMPITGSYRVIRQFGAYNLGGATLVSNGIQLEGKAGAKARCVFDGEVSSVLNPGGGYVVMVRHGRYITVYGNLSSVSVSKGQKVRTNQTLGTVGTGCVLVFRLQNWRDPINPKPWLGR